MLTCLWTRKYEIRTPQIPTNFDKLDDCRTDVHQNKTRKQGVFRLINNQ